ncbi:cytochrome P450 [Halobaculum magnesiiphilum]|uniref:Cytochrome P450 n=1 Tax=Halobaculum magnesiiphilum TaxID=1017351 RepID=A0A8T8WDF6_9EURY|nr:cytochrome P450 [Halobaculum magnesiiphilum]QZP37865.1 cytochrome P450 [Halobaculum magnesiiphilum]
MNGSTASEGAAADEQSHGHARRSHDPDAAIADRRTEGPAAAGSDPERAPLPPGPDGVPVLGTLPRFVRDPFAFYDRLFAYGDVVSYDFGLWNNVTLFHPDDVQRVLVDDADRFRKSHVQRRSGVDFLENGLLLTEGEEWREQRTQLQPLFYREKIETFAGAMVEEARELVDSWDDGEVVDLVDAYSTLAMRVLGRTLFGVDVHDGDGYEVIRRAATSVQERADAGSVTAFLPDWVPTPANRRFARDTDAFREYVDRLVRERRGSDPADADDLLTLLVGLGEGDALSDEAVRDQLMTFLFAGHETTSLALSYATHALARRPDIADDLRAEAAAAGDLDAAAIRSLDLTDRVVSESLRTYPPAYVLFREPTEDVVVGGYRIPAGTNISLPIWRLHTDPRWWDDPESFDPSRWLDEDPDRPEHAYLPFGAGPRHCIGMRFASLELRATLATVFREIAFDPVPADAGEPSFEAAATLQPSEPLRVRVSKR